VAGAKIDVELKNSSSNDVEDGEIYFGKHFVFGPHCFVGKSYSKTYLGYPYADGSSAEVEWTTKGIKHEKTVDLEKVLPEKKSGQLTFTIFDDRVEVSFKPEKS